MSGPQTDIKGLLCLEREQLSTCPETLQAFPIDRCRGRWQFFSVSWTDPCNVAFPCYQLQGQFIFCISAELCWTQSVPEGLTVKRYQQCDQIPLALRQIALTSAFVCWMSLLRGGRSHPQCHESQWTPHSSSARRGLGEESKSRCPMNTHRELPQVTTEEAVSWNNSRDSLHVQGRVQQWEKCRANQK